MINLTLVGTGGMIPLYNRFLTSLYLNIDGHCILIDCGEGTQMAISKASLSAYDIDSIFITHHHGDHIFGINGLLSTINNQGRTELINIYGPMGTKNLVEGYLSGINLNFPLEFHELTQNIENFKIGSLSIDAFTLDHSTICYGYKINLERRPRFLPEKAKELNIPVKLWKHLQKGEKVIYQGNTYLPQDVLGDERKGISLVYATDTRPCSNLENFSKDADILITEAIYADPPLLNKAKSKKHMHALEACKLAKRAKVKELWLTHYSPALQNISQYKKIIKSEFNNVHLSQDGDTKELKFKDK